MAYLLLFGIPGKMNEEQVTSMGLAIALLSKQPLQRGLPGRSDRVAARSPLANA